MQLRMANLAFEWTNENYCVFSPLKQLHRKAISGAEGWINISILILINAELQETQCNVAQQHHPCAASTYIWLIFCQHRLARFLP